jgi:hypothetical protein
MLYIVSRIAINRPGGYGHAIDIQYTLPIVRGKAPMKLTTNPTTPKTIVQVPWLVMVLKTTVKVRM